MILELARKLIKYHEGFSSKPYPCTEGKLTIGYGRNLDDNGISLDEADMLLGKDMEVCINYLSNEVYWDALSDTRKSALIDMVYNLGPRGFSRFKLMRAALAKGDYNRAAYEMLNSKWAAQTKRRAVKLSKIMRKGIDE
jgi:lysozyme